MTPNPQQTLVIEHFEGPCLVMAVPGSGKTASVTERTKRLIQRGVDPRSILAITFTNKAAGEMRARIAKAVGADAASKMTISTFHSLCSRIIRHNCEALGLGSNYSIYDSDDQERLLKSCIRRIEDPDNAKSAFKPSKSYTASLMGFIEGKRNACLSDQAAAERYGLSGNQFKVAQEYFDQLKMSNAVDFTGLLSETLRLFEERTDIRDKYRSRFRFISIDEVQDTNIAQYEIIKHLGLGHGNVLCVGDISQSIYMFRNADPENILRFEKDFQNCKNLKLECNYRSTPSILHHCQKLIENNKFRKDTLLTTINSDAAPPIITAGVTDGEMAMQIANAVQKALHAGIKPAEIAILYRTNYASRVLEIALRTLQIKYKIIGGLSFWDRMEVKCGLAILKLICNHNDRMAFEKVGDACCRGVGDKTLEMVFEISKNNHLTIMQAARRVATNGTPSGKCLWPLINALDTSGDCLPGQGLLKIAQQTSFWDRLERESTDTNDRCQNLIEMARDVDDYCSNPKNSLPGYLQNISLLTDSDEEDDEKFVRLMTLHGCKGLEFDVVHISHCNAGIIPHDRIYEEATDPAALEKAIEEERRLMYVGMTRARKSLSMHFAASKVDARSRQAKPILPSQFLYETEIESSDLEKYRGIDTDSDLSENAV